MPAVIRDTRCRTYSYVSFLSGWRIIEALAALREVLLCLNLLPVPCLGKTASKPSHSSLMTALQLDSTRGCEAEKRYTGHTYTYSIASASRQRELYAGLRLTIPESAIGAEHRSCGWFADGLSDGPRCAPLFCSVRRLRVRSAPLDPPSLPRPLDD